jgi:hypothetical protein
MGNPAFLKRLYSGKATPSHQGHPTTATSRATQRGRRRGRRSTRRRRRIIDAHFLLTTSKVLSIFLRAPSVATPCASNACSSITFIPSRTYFKVRRVLVQSERAQPPNYVFQPLGRNILRFSSPRCSCGSSVAVGAAASAQAR